jgi:hypothetical protein
MCGVLGSEVNHTKQGQSHFHQHRFERRADKAPCTAAHHLQLLQTSSGLVLGSPTYSQTWSLSPPDLTGLASPRMHNTLSSHLRHPAGHAALQRRTGAMHARLPGACGPCERGLSQGGHRSKYRHVMPRWVLRVWRAWLHSFWLWA